MSVEHVKLAVFIAAAAVVFIETFEGVFDAGEIGDASVNGFQKIKHGKERAIESRDVVEIEGELGSAAGNLLAIFNEFFNASHLWEGRSHRTDAPSADGLGVFRQTSASFMRSSSVSIYPSPEEPLMNTPFSPLRANRAA